MDSLQDKTIKCFECNKEFIFSVRDQKYFKTMNFQDPKRCKECKENFFINKKLFWKGGGKVG